MKTWVMSTVLILAIFGAANAEMFIWTDENGVKHYTDTAPPAEGAEVEIKEEIKTKDADRERPSRDVDDGYWERESLKYKMKDDAKKSHWRDKREAQKQKHENEELQKQMEIDAAQRKIDRLKDEIMSYEQTAKGMYFEKNEDTYQKKAAEAREELKRAESEMRSIQWRR